MPDVGDVCIFIGKTRSGKYGLSVSEESHSVWHSSPFETEKHVADLADTVWEHAEGYCADPVLPGQISLADHLDKVLGDCSSTDVNDHIVDAGKTQIY